MSQPAVAGRRPFRRPARPATLPATSDPSRRRPRPATLPAAGAKAYAPGDARAASHPRPEPHGIRSPRPDLARRPASSRHCGGPRGRPRRPALRAGAAVPARPDRGAAARRGAGAAVPAPGRAAAGPRASCWPPACPMRPAELELAAFLCIAACAVILAGLGWSVARLCFKAQNRASDTVREGCPAGDPRRAGRGAGRGAQPRPDRRRGSGPGRPAARRRHRPAGDDPRRPDPGAGLRGARRPAADPGRAGRPRGGRPRLRRWCWNGRGTGRSCACAPARGRRRT